MFGSNRIVEALDLVVLLGGDAANEPVIKGRHLTEGGGGSVLEFAVGLWEHCQNDIALIHRLLTFATE